LRGFQIISSITCLGNFSLGARQGHRFKTMGDGPDIRLRNMDIRNSWGCQMGHTVGNVLVLDDDNYLIIVGKRICQYTPKETHKSRYLFPHLEKTRTVIFIELSPDRKYVAASSFTNESLPTIIVYAIAHTQGLHRHPKEISVLPTQSWTGRTVTGMRFSSDSTMLAAWTNLPGDGVLVYDWMLGELIQQVSQGTTVCYSSFNPKDPSRLCVTGADDVLEFWHYTKRGSHIAPISSLPDLESQYLTHCWLENDTILCGTDEGKLVLIQGVVVIETINAFGVTPQNANIEIPVSKILHRHESNTIVVFSEDARLTIFEVTRKDAARGKKGSGKITLEITSRYHIEPSELQPNRDLLQADWANNNPSSMLMNIIFQGSVELFDPKRNDFVGNPSDSVLLNMVSTQFDTHTGAITQGVFGNRTTMTVTLSADRTVRVWDLNVESGAAPVAEQYYERPSELPTCIAMHPSGRWVAFGTDEYVKEYAILNQNLSLVQTIPIRVPLKGGGGENLMNVYPVGGLEYSNGGHLIAVVTGKYVQIFEKYNLNFDGIEKSGMSVKFQDCCDHSAYITSCKFSHNDSKLFTCALDGSCFEWIVGQQGQRNAGNFQKGVCVQMHISPISEMITVLYEISDQPTAATKKVLASNRRGSSAVGSKDDRDSANRRMSMMTPNKSGRQSNSRGSLLLTSPLMSGTSDGGGAGDFFAGGGILSPASFRRDASASQPTSTVGPTRRNLVCWSNGKIGPALPEVYEINVPVNCFVFTATRGPEEVDKTEYCIMGLLNGDVMISIFPLPFRVVMTDVIPELVLPNMSPPSSRPGTSSKIEVPKEMNVLDEKQLRTIPLHCGAIQCVVKSNSGHWIMTYGADGHIFMLSTKRSDHRLDMPEVMSAECSVAMTPKTELQTQLQLIEDLERKIEDMVHSNERESVATIERCNKHVAEVETKMATEIRRRDEIIIRERDVNIRRLREAAEELENAKIDGVSQAQQLEVMYEKKLATEAMYLNKMRQAYDEFVSHSRFDLQDAQAAAQGREKSIHQQNRMALEDAEKQKAILLMYVQYVNDRYKEVLNTNEDKHEQQTMALENKVLEASAGVEKVIERGRKDAAFLQRALTEARMESDSKDKELLQMKGKVDWANDRVSRMEEALERATAEISKTRTDAGRWELRAGEKSQQVNELEHVRQMLTSQLHLLREELGPKEHTLAQMAGKLKEMDLEYDNTLESVSEKDRLLNAGNSKLHLLQKQVRQLRNGKVLSDGTLKRAYTCLSEYVHSFQDAIFDRRKATVSHTYIPVSGMTPMEAFRAQQEEDELVKKLQAERALLSGVGDNADETHEREDREKARHVISQKTAKSGANADIISALAKLQQQTTSNELVELVSATPAMVKALVTLQGILKPFASDHKEADMDEINDEEELGEHGRQMEQMRRSLLGLEKNVANANAVSFAKGKALTQDNRLLIKELNDIRRELVDTKRDREKYKAKLDSTERKVRNLVTTSVASSSVGNERIPSPKYAKRVGAFVDDDEQSYHSVMSEISMAVDAKGNSIEKSKSQYGGPVISKMHSQSFDQALKHMQQTVSVGPEFQVTLRPEDLGSVGSVSVTKSVGSFSALDKINSLMDENEASIKAGRARTPDVLARELHEIVVGSTSAGDIMNSQMGSSAQEEINKIIGAINIPIKPDERYLQDSRKDKTERKFRDKQRVNAIRRDRSAPQLGVAFVPPKTKLSFGSHTAANIELTPEIKLPPVTVRLMAKSDIRK